MLDYSQNAPTPIDFLGDATGIASRIRSFDWSTTALGPVQDWPQSLKTTTALLVRSAVPMVLLWGPDGVMIYNDAYSIFAGDRHPKLFGANVRQGWPEVADFNDNVMKVGLAGNSLAYKDQELTLFRRDGKPEQVWLDLDYSPVLDETGRPAGVIAIVVETTHRVLADRRIASDTQRQQQLFSQMPGFVGVMSGPAHIYEYVNEAYIKIADRSDFIGRSVREVFPDLEGQGFYELLDQVYDSGQRVVSRDMELRLHGGNEVRYIDFVYEPIRDEAGHVSGIFVGGYEVSEARRATAALRASEEQLRLATENAEIGLWDVDLVNDTLYWPPRVKAMFGISPDVAVSMSDFYNGLHPEDRDYTSEAYARASDPALRSVYDVEYRTIGKEDGVIRWVAAKGRGVFTNDVCVRMIGTALDISARKAVEKRLQDLNETLERQVIERTQARGRTWQVSPDLMGALNSQGYFETSNPAWNAMLGWSEDEVRSMSMFELLHPDDVERTREGFDLMQQGQPAIRFPNRYRCKDGSYRWISWVGVPEDGMVYCTGRDITEEKLAAEELAKAQAALRQSQKMEAIGQLTGGIAHDFNNLLAGITGSIELLERRLAQGRLGETQRYIDAAQSAAKRAATLTQRLLAFSRRQTLDPKPTDINHLIEGVSELIQRTVGPNVALRILAKPELWPTRIDPSQLENALLNLCINARDAMPEGGDITVKTANHVLEERSARKWDIAAGDYVCIEVTDTGTGMTPNVIEQAFDPFFTTKPLGQGTGLGLSMIHGFVHQSGGHVHIVSAPGAGTTICIFLPRYEGTVRIDGEGRATDRTEPGHGETILVIDDEVTVRMLMVEELEEAGYRVLTASDGRSGMNVLQSGVKVDLLVTDVGLPGGMNGRQVADAARVTNPDLLVLFVTGYAENAGIEDGRLDAGMHVISKPFAMTALTARVRGMLEKT